MCTVTFISILLGITSCIQVGTVTFRGHRSTRCGRKAQMRACIGAMRRSTMTMTSP